MSASPRCPEDGTSVGEFIPLFKEARAYYRKKYNGDDEKVAKEMVEMCDNYEINNPSARQMLFSADTIDDFVARINTYK